jgi:hypothetical protein
MPTPEIPQIGSDRLMQQNKHPSNSNHCVKTAHHWSRVGTYSTYCVEVPRLPKESENVGRGETHGGDTDEQPKHQEYKSVPTRNFHTQQLKNWGFLGFHVRRRFVRASEEAAH